MQLWQRRLVLSSTHDTPAAIIEKVKSLSGELASITQRYTCKDARRVRVPTLLLNGEQGPKLPHRIIDIHSYCMPNNEQARIPGASHELGLMEKPEVFNKLVQEFLSKHTQIQQIW